MLLTDWLNCLILNFQLSILNISSTKLVRDIICELKPHSCFCLYFLLCWWLFLLLWFYLFLNRIHLFDIFLCPLRNVDTDGSSSSLNFNFNFVLFLLIVRPLVLSLDSKKLINYIRFIFLLVVAWWVNNKNRFFVRSTI